MKLEGIEEAEKVLKEMGDLLSMEIVREASYQMASDLRGVVKSEAPKGPTGNLKKAVKANLIKKKRGVGQNVYNPQAEVYIDPSIAPHAHLVEFGHLLVKGGKLWTGGKKKLVPGGKVIGQVPGNDFFGRSIKKQRRVMEKSAIDGLNKAIDKVIEKHGDT